jgi:hypothetical protein
MKGKRVFKLKNSNGRKGGKPKMCECICVIGCEQISEGETYKHYMHTLQL